ncbi:MAG: hypothetical protein HQK72_08355 [Desulfamplus sp.]|nr:hypothetical protein [Desulfamplus sp.]
MNLHQITETLLQILSNILPSMFIGLYLADILSKSGYLNNAGILMAPLAGFANLPKRCSSVLTLCLLNKEAAFSMLSELKRKDDILDKEVIAVSMLAHFPLSIRSIIFFVVPISFSTLGVHIGLMFTSIYFCLELLKTLIGISAGRLMLNKSEKSILINEIEKKGQHSGWINLLIVSVKDTVISFKRLLIKIIPTLLIAVLLLNAGLVEWLSRFSAPFTKIVGLPPASCFVIISGLPSMIAGITSAKPLITSGVITSIETVKILILTYMLHSLYNIIRMSLPVNITLFGTALGCQVTLISFILEFISIPVFFILSIITVS